jgi:hypothetical protein
MIYSWHDAVIIAVMGCVELALLAVVVLALS